MGWFNYIGLCVIVVIMIPNIIFACTNKNGFKNAEENSLLEKIEQIGRFGSFTFLIFNVPYTYFNFFFDEAFWIYLFVSASFCLLYITIWCICWNKFFIFRTYALSIIPSILFIFSGIMLLNIPLLVFSVIFAITHITISIKNVKKR